MCIKESYIFEEEEQKRNTNKKRLIQATTPLSQHLAYANTYEIVNNNSMQRRQSVSV